MIRIVDDGPFRGEFTELFERLMIETSVLPLPKILMNYPSDMREYLDTLYGAFDETYDIRFEDISRPRCYDVGDNNKVVLAFSGGKDSVATALKLKNDGYDVILYHVAGLNRSYSQEVVYADKLANLMGMELIVKYITMSGKADFGEVPTKNQYLLGCIVDYGVANGINKFALGSIKSDKISVVNNHFELSDTVELYESLNSFYSGRVVGYQLLNFLENITDSYRTLLTYDYKLLPYVSSCMSPARYKYGLRRHNISKFGLKQMPGRCGSCYKCAYEYVGLHLMGLTPDNKEFLKHEVDILIKDHLRRKPNYGGVLDAHGVISDVHDVCMINKFRNTLSDVERYEISSYLYSDEIMNLDIDTKKE